jgi:HK97 family phage prohead protease
MENNVIYRSSELVSLDEQEKQTVTGYALVFGVPTCLGRDADGKAFYELVDRGALAGCDLSNVVMRYNHNDSNLILARTSNGTLTLDIDDTGLKITADIAKTSQGTDIYKLIQRKDIDKMSVAYVPSAIDYDYQTNTQRVMGISQLIDVSAVDLPAYDDTSIQASYRSAEKAKQEYESNQAKKKKLELLLNI